MPGEFTGHERGSRDYRRLLVGLFFAGIATFAQLYSFQAVLPSISRRFEVDAATAALTVSAVTIGLAAGVIPWSSVADRIGRVRAMAVGMIAATVIGLLAPFSPDLGILLAARVLEGVMVGSVPAIAVAYLSEEVDPRHAARAAGTYVAGTTIGGLAGRIIAGPIADVGDWRLGVFAVAVLCAASAGLFLALVPASRGFVPLGSRPADPGPTPGRRLALNLRSPIQLALYAQAFLLMGGFVAVYNYLGFRLAAVPFELSPIAISLLFLAYLAGSWSSAQAGALAADHGRMPVLLGSIGIMTAGVLLSLSDLLPLVLTGLLVLTAGFFAAHATASGWAPVSAPGGRAQASSLYNLAYYAGSSLFGWLGGLVFVASGWTGLATGVACTALLAGAVAGVALRRSTAGWGPTRHGSHPPE